MRGRGLTYLSWCLGMLAVLDGSAESAGGFCWGSAPRPAANDDHRPVDPLHPHQRVAVPQVQRREAAEGLSSFGVNELR